MLQRGFTDEIKMLIADAIIGAVQNEKLNEVLTRIGKHLDSPLRLYASATPDEFLNIGASLVEAGDGAGFTTPPIDGNIGSFTLGQIGFQAKTAPASVKIDGGTFTFPATTVGEYRRLVFAYQSNGDIEAKWSEADAAVGNLANAGTLMDSLEGMYIGHIDLESTDAGGEFKTAGSSTNIIENKVGSDIRVFRAGSGSGAGSGGGDTSWKAQSLIGTSLKIKKGYFFASDGSIYGTGNMSASTDLADVTIDLASIVASPDDDSYYGLFIDRTKVSEITLSDNDRKIYPVYQASEMVLIKDLYPKQANKYRYIPVAGFKTPGSGNTFDGATFYSEATRTHDEQGSLETVPETKTDVSITSAAASNVVAHGLSGAPQVIDLWFWDDSESKKVPISRMSHLVDKDGTNVTINSNGLTFDAGDYIIIDMMHTPSLPNRYIDSSRTFKTPWYEDNSVTTVPHNLTDKFDIADLSLLEWDVTNDKMRTLSASSLVVNWDDTNVYLDWTGLSPSSTLKFKLVSGQTALPIARPIQGNSFEFTDSITLTDSTTAFPCDKMFNDEPRKISAVQKLSNGWANVDNIGTLVWVTDDANNYLRGDLTDLSPSATYPVIITVE